MTRERTLEHPSMVDGLAFWSDGAMLATAALDGVRLWCLSDMSIARTFTGLIGGGSLAFSVDSAVLAIGTMNDIQLFQVNSGDRSQVFRLEQAHFRSVAISPDGELVAGGGSLHTARIWQRRDGAIVATLPHEFPVNAVAFNPDGGTLATLCFGAIKFWRSGDGELIGSLNIGADDGYDLAYTPDGTLLASTHVGGTRLWRIGGGVVRTFADGIRSISALDISPGAELLATAEDEAVLLWNLSNGQLVQTLVYHTSRIMDVAFSPNGSLLASASSDKSVQLWHAA